MAELPKPPSLNPDGRPEEEEPNIDVSSAIADTLAEGSDDAGAGSAQAPQATPPAAPADDVASAPAALPKEDSLGDTVDEVLHQASEQSLRLNQVSDSLQSLARNVEDFQEEFHDGFVELRGVIGEVKNAAAAASQQKAVLDPAILGGLEHRVDALDEHVRKQLQGYMSLAKFQLFLTVLLIAAVIAIPFLGIGGGESGAPDAPKRVVEEGNPVLAPAGQEIPVGGSASEQEEEEPPDPQPQRRKRRRRRR